MEKDTKLAFKEGDRVRINIPDEDDFDHDVHGKTGVITLADRDSLDQITGNPDDAEAYVVELDDEDSTVPVRLPDLQPYENDEE